jgi:hypothetical protein
MRRLTILVLLFGVAAAACNDSGTTFTFDAGGADTKTSIGGPQTDAGADTVANPTSSVGAVNVADAAADAAAADAQ